MKKILLIDDDEANRLSLSFMLEDEGYAVDVAGSCAEGRVVIDANDGFDVVIVDYHLGDGTGVELLPLVRAKHPRARIALLSGDAIKGAVVDVVLTKGMDPAVLLSTVRRLADQS